MAVTSELPGLPARAALLESLHRRVSRRAAERYAVTRETKQGVRRPAIKLYADCDSSIAPLADASHYERQMTYTWSIRERQKHSIIPHTRTRDCGSTA